MQIGVFGTGMVGEAIADKLVSLGHEVKMGSRTANNEKAAAWVKSAGARASQGTFADAASFGEILFNCTGGGVSLQVLEQAGDGLRGKVLVDLANPLDFSKGRPPRLSVSNDDSLGEQIQRAHPDVKVVKTLNTVNCDVMVNPAKVSGDHTMFLCGNDEGAKKQVLEILTEWFGWRDVIDLGDITAARALESMLHVWLRLMGALKTVHFNVKVVR
ncbi:MAG: NAD(P)-binding domain-containing protein [Polyangiaceae bacterium]|nr:NAD(P)-binding domain-containing protein [Polyangiaceae bacterium]